MLHLPSQELWTLLASACEQTSGIPKKILDDKAEELRIKNEAQKAIQVSKLNRCSRGLVTLYKLLVYVDGHDCLYTARTLLIIKM